MHAGGAQVKWALTNEQLGTTLARGEGSAPTVVHPGDVQGLQPLDIQLPQVLQPVVMQLAVQVVLSGQRVNNSWDFYLFPSLMYMESTPLCCYDPRHEALPLPTWMHHVTDMRTATGVVLAFSWDADVATYVREGGQVILVCAQQHQPAPVVLQPAPFWREALRIVMAHPAWGDFPHQGWAGRQFASMASDVVIADNHLPLLRRLDTRTMETAAYAVELELGRGRLVVTTLRLMGGLGNQPRGVAMNPAAQYMVTQWVRYLAQ
jgi:hypothetical protein